MINIKKLPVARFTLAMGLILFVAAYLGCFDKPDYSHLNGKIKTFKGRVTSMSQKISAQGKDQLGITLSDVEVIKNTGENAFNNNAYDLPKHLPGILCYVDIDKETTIPLMGETICIRGKVSALKRPSNPGGFDAYHYYLSKNIHLLLYSASVVEWGEYFNPYLQNLYMFKQKTGKIIDMVCQNESGSMRAILLGDKAFLEEEVMDLYRDGGISHILAISGLHISFMGAGLYKLLRKRLIKRAIAVPFSAFVIISYVLMVGPSPSSIRAVVMYLLSLLADILGRTPHILTSLSIAAFLLMCENPLILLQSGFLLSFGAIMGVGALLPSFLQIYGKEKHKEAILGGLSISLFTLPVMLVFFYSFPLYSFVLNLLVIPLMGVVMVSGIAAIILGWGAAIFSFGKGFLTAGRLVFIPGGILLKVFQMLCEIAINLPKGRIITGIPDPVLILGFYALLIVIMLCKKYLSPFLCSLIVVFSVLILTAKSPSRIGESISVLDVGQGDCSVIKTGNDRVFIVDGGSSSMEKPGDKVIIPYLKSQGISKVEGIFISHTDLDHINGIIELINNGKREGIRINNLILQDITEPDPEYKGIVNDGIKNGIKIKVMGEGDGIYADGISIKCLNPPKKTSVYEKNDSSMVLFMESENSGLKALFPGDLDGNGEKRFIERLLNPAEGYGMRNPDIDILKVGHHGSKNSSSKELLELLKPQIATISCSAKNRYRHPSPQTISRLKDAGSTIYVTKDCGAITIRPRPEGLKVVVQKRIE